MTRPWGWLLALLLAGCQPPAVEHAAPGARDRTMTLWEPMIEMRCEGSRMHIYVDGAPQETVEGMATIIIPLWNWSWWNQVSDPMYFDLCPQRPFVTVP